MTRRQNRPKSTTVVDPIVVKTERDDEEPTALSPSMIRSTPNLPAAQPSSRRESKPKVEQTEVHEDDTDVTEITHRTVGVRAREGSIMSVQEAQVSIDTFVDGAQKQKYTSKKENKLRLWQALCIEFGLVQADNDIRVPNLCAILEESDHDINVPLRSSHLPPSPTSLTQANNLLKAHVHVNIKDYLTERRKPIPAGQTRDMSHLLFPSTSALIRYTVQNKRFAKPSVVKDAYLEPLMREMSYGRRRR